MAEKKIAGETYRVNPLPAKEAIALYLDLTRVATQGVGRIPAIIELASAGESTMAEAAALSALGDVLARNPSEDLISLLERIVGAASVKRPSGEFVALDLDEEFSGRLSAVLPVAKFVLETNYAGFFPASAGSGILNGLRGLLATPKSAG